MKENDQQTRQIAAPMYYDDGEVIHACESFSMHAGPAVVMTECGNHVPPGQGFILEYSTIEVTCSKCRSGEVTRATPDFSAGKPPEAERH
jgi:hypothetical protein